MTELQRHQRGHFGHEERESGQLNVEGFLGFDDQLVDLCQRNII